MAENGTIISTALTDVRRDDILNKPIVKYSNPSNLPLVDGSIVTMDVNEADRVPATILTIVTPSDPDFPQDSDYPGANIITSPVNGDLNVNGGTTIVKGTTVTGNVTISNNGTFVLKSTDDSGAQRAKVTGSVTATANGTGNLNIYKSDINGSLRFFNNTEAKAKGVIIGGDTDIRNSAKAKINGGTIGGDTDIRNMKTSVDVQDLTLTGAGKNLDVRNNGTTTTVKNVTVNSGDVTIRNNQGCTYSNINTPNGTKDISGCTSV
jgi:hypothetical protein